MVHRPDFASDDLDDVLNYAMLTDDFNRLPIDERMKLLSELVKRLKSSSSGDSAMLAAFAAGIEGQLRDQFVTNSAKLAVDMFDQYARNYDKVPEEQREKYLEDSFADMTKKMEAVAGVTRNVSDADRVSEVRRQAQRHQDWTTLPICWERPVNIAYYLAKRLLKALQTSSE
jgi:glutamate synthase domain-containing protein 1